MERLTDEELAALTPEERAEYEQLLRDSAPVDTESGMPYEAREAITFAGTDPETQAAAYRKHLGYEKDDPRVRTREVKKDLLGVDWLWPDSTEVDVYDEKDNKWIQSDEEGVTKRDLTADMKGEAPKMLGSAAAAPLLFIPGVGWVAAAALAAGPAMAGSMAGDMVRQQVHKNRGFEETPEQSSRALVQAGAEGLLGEFIGGAGTEAVKAVGKRVLPAAAKVVGKVLGKETAEQPLKKLENSVLGEVMEEFGDPDPAVPDAPLERFSLTQPSTTTKYETHNPFSPDVSKIDKSLQKDLVVDKNTSGATTDMLVNAASELGDSIRQLRGRTEETAQLVGNNVVDAIRSVGSQEQAAYKEALTASGLDVAPLTPDLRTNVAKKVDKVLEDFNAIFVDDALTSHPRIGKKIAQDLYNFRQELFSGTVNTVEDLRGLASDVFDNIPQDVRGTPAGAAYKAVSKAFQEGIEDASKLYGADEIMKPANARYRWWKERENVLRDRFYPTQRDTARFDKTLRNLDSSTMRVTRQAMHDLASNFPEVANAMEDALAWNQAFKWDSLAKGGQQSGRTRLGMGMAAQASDILGHVMDTDADNIFDKWYSLGAQGRGLSGAKIPIRQRAVQGTKRAIRGATDILGEALTGKESTKKRLDDISTGALRDRGRMKISNNSEFIPDRIVMASERDSIYGAVEDVVDDLSDDLFDNQYDADELMSIVEDVLDKTIEKENGTTADQIDKIINRYVMSFLDRNGIQHAEHFENKLTKAVSNVLKQGEMQGNNKYHSGYGIDKRGSRFKKSSTPEYPKFDDPKEQQTYDREFEQIYKRIKRDSGDDLSEDEILTSAHDEVSSAFNRSGSRFKKSKNNGIDEEITFDFDPSGEERGKIGVILDNFQNIMNEIGTPNAVRATTILKNNIKNTWGTKGKGTIPSEGLEQEIRDVLGEFIDEGDISPDVVVDEVIQKSAHFVDSGISAPKFRGEKTKGLRNFTKGVHPLLMEDKDTPRVLLHGTTQGGETGEGITEFASGKRGSRKNYFGPHTYASDTPADVSHNYARVGPDAEATMEFMTTVIRNKENISTTEAAKKARAKIDGGQNNTIPVIMGLRNPAVIDTDNFSGYATEVLPEMYKKIEELIGYDLQDLYSDESPNLANILNALRDSGDLDGNQISNILQELGYDGVIDLDAGSRFYGMKGMKDDTMHVVAFNPEDVKSAIGNRGTYSRESKDIRFSSKQGGKSSVKPWTGADNELTKLTDKYPELEGRVNLTDQDEDFIARWDDDGTITINPYRIKNAKEFKEAFLHEGIGHDGVRNVLGSDYDKGLMKIAKAHPDRINKKIAEYAKEGVELDELAAADEVLAELAERSKTSGVVGEVIGSFRDIFWRRTGMMKPSHGDMLFLLSRAHRKQAADSVSKNQVRGQTILGHGIMDVIGNDESEQNQSILGGM